MADDVRIEPARLLWWSQQDVEPAAGALCQDRYDRAISAFLAAECDFSTWGIHNLAHRVDDLEVEARRLAHAAEDMADGMHGLDRTFAWSPVAQGDIPEATFHDLVADWQAWTPTAPADPGTRIDGEEGSVDDPATAPDEVAVPDRDHAEDAIWWAGIGATAADRTGRLVDDRLVVDVSGYTTRSGRSVASYQRWRAPYAARMRAASTARRWAGVVRSPAASGAGHAAPFVLAGVDQYLEDRADDSLTSTHQVVRVTTAVGLEGGGGWIGASAGAKAGVALGAAGGPVGAVVGGVVGAIGGGVVGAEAGDWVHDRLDEVWSTAADGVDAVVDGLESVGHGLAGMAEDVGEFLAGPS